MGVGMKIHSCKAGSSRVLRECKSARTGNAVKLDGGEIPGQDISEGVLLLEVYSAKTC